MDFEPDKGDVLIKRVSNGWIAVSSDHDDSNSVYVYEDPSEPMWTAKSLCELLKDQFNGYTQTKRSGGIKISFSEESKEEEEVMSS